MAQQLNQAGTFRGNIIDHGLFEAESGAVGVNLKFQILEAWDADAQAWTDWAEYDVECDGCVWVVKKDGTVNQAQSQSLMKAAGWNGDLASIGTAAWECKPCAVVVNKDEYKGDVRYRIAFVNEFDRTPGGVGNCDPEKAKALQAKYGSQFRALAGSVNANKQAPAANKPKMPGKAPKPAPATKQPDNTITGVGTGTKQTTDDIPF